MHMLLRFIRPQNVTNDNSIKIVLCQYTSKVFPRRNKGHVAISSVCLTVILWIQPFMMLSLLWFLESQFSRDLVSNFEYEINIHLYGVCMGSIAISVRVAKEKGKQLNHIDTDQIKKKWKQNDDTKRHQ